MLKEHKVAGTQKRCVIIGGADIGDYHYIRSILREDDFFIFSIFFKKLGCGVKSKGRESFRT